MRAMWISARSSLVACMLVACGSSEAAPPVSPTGSASRAHDSDSRSPAAAEASEPDASAATPDAPAEAQPAHCRFVSDITDLCQPWGESAVLRMQCEGHPPGTGFGRWALGSCPREGLLGVCVIGEVRVHYYSHPSSRGPSEAARACELANGAFEPIT
jgi:hypothetical protein